MENEIWKDISGFEGIYQVSNFGNVKSLARQSAEYITSKGNLCSYYVNEKILKSAKSYNGYLRVLLVDKENDLRFNKSVHRLVLENFNPIENMNDLTVNHLDGNKENNILSNLEWATMKEQIAHAKAIGLKKDMKQDGELNKMAKLKNSDVIYIYENIDNLTIPELSKKFNICRGSISDIWRRKSWKHITLNLTVNKILLWQPNSTKGDDQKCQQI